MWVNIWSSGEIQLSLHCCSRAFSTSNWKPRNGIQRENETRAETKILYKHRLNYQQYKRPPCTHCLVLRLSLSCQGVIPAARRRQWFTIDSFDLLRKKIGHSVCVSGIVVLVFGVLDMLLMSEAVEWIRGSKKAAAALSWSPVSKRGFCVGVWTVILLNLAQYWVPT